MIPQCQSLQLEIITFADFTKRVLTALVILQFQNNHLKPDYYPAVFNY